MYGFSRVIPACNGDPGLQRALAHVTNSVDVHDDHDNDVGSVLGAGSV